MSEIDAEVSRKALRWSWEQGKGSSASVASGSGNVAGVIDKSVDDETLTEIRMRMLFV